MDVRVLLAIGFGLTLVLGIAIGFRLGMMKRKVVQVEVPVEVPGPTGWFEEQTTLKDGRRIGFRNTVGGLRLFAYVEAGQPNEENRVMALGADMFDEQATDPDGVTPVWTAQNHHNQPRWALNFSRGRIVTRA